MTGAALIESDLLKRLERLSFLTRRTFRGAGRGERRTRAAGVSTEFRDHRAYAPGDDLRHLDWNLYARLDRPFLKRFHDHSEVTVHLVLDASASMTFGTPPKLRLARQLAGALGYLALVHSDRVVLHVLGGPVPASGEVLAGRAGARRLLAQLADLQAGGAVDLGEAFAAVARGIPRPGLVAVISDLLSPGAADGLQHLAAGRHQLDVVQVLAPQEIDPGTEASLSGDVRLVDSETGHEIVASLSPRMLDLYRGALAALDADLALAARRLGATVTRVSSATPVPEVVFEHLQAAGVLG